MKLLNIKNIALFSAVIVGGLASLNANAQSLSGGAGGGNNGTDGGPSTTSSPSIPSNAGATPTLFSQGGGGGGGGVLGGAGGNGTGLGGGYGLGGNGGTSLSPNGSAGGNGTGLSGGGGGGGGAAGVVINSSASNAGSVSGGTGGAGGNGGSVTSSGGGGGGAGGYGAIVNSGIYTNSGTIRGGAGGAGGISGSGYSNASGGAGGLGVYLGTSSNLVNSGTISGGAGGAIGTGGPSGSGGSNGSNASGVYIASGSTSSITNTGTINGGGSGAYGIQNAGTVSTLNNSQGAGNAAGALMYTGALPTNYNIIIKGSAQYGQLAVTGGSGTTTFGIYAGGVAGVAASTLNKGTYSSVLSGVTSSNLTGATSGNYSGFTWRLNNSSGSIWDLIVTGASTADTQQSLVNTASALQNTFTLQNTVLANSFSYDCNVFGANNVCVSAGGRNTQVSAANGLNNTSALLIAAYRVMPSVRIGAYADQNLSVNNAGSTVNLGNNTPLIGLFGAWNERLDGTGTEVKVSAAYGQKNTTVNRQVVGLSEAGSGSSQLNSQGAQVTAKYGFGVTPDVIVSPYVGMRYTQNNMNGYSEQATSSVTAPLTYSALNTNATTALAGVGAQYEFIPQATVFASAGVETDTNTSNGTYSATGITGLTPINFNANPVKTRPTATVGAYYDVEKNQRLGITGIYRQEPYQAVQTTTVMATYTVGL